MLTPDYIDSFEDKDFGTFSCWGFSLDDLFIPILFDPPAV